MNFFDFASLSRKKDDGLFNCSGTLSTSLKKPDLDLFQPLKNTSLNDTQNDQKAFEALKTLNAELDNLVNESEQRNSELDQIIEDFTQLNKNMEILFGSVISDIND